MSGARELGSGDPQTERQMPTTVSSRVKWKWKTLGSRRAQRACGSPARGVGVSKVGVGVLLLGRNRMLAD